MLLHVRELAVVVLDDLGREIVENLFFEPAEQERQNLFMQRLQSQRCYITKLVLLENG